VSYLWDEVRSLRIQLLDAQLHTATIEAEVRDEVVKETEEHIHELKLAYDRRLQTEVSLPIVIARTTASRTALTRRLCSDRSS
jgi:hypothetical protein